MAIRHAGDSPAPSTPPRRVQTFSNISSFHSFSCGLDTSPLPNRATLESAFPFAKVGEPSQSQSNQCISLTREQSEADSKEESVASLDSLLASSPGRLLCGPPIATFSMFRHLNPFDPLFPATSGPTTLQHAAALLIQRAEEEARRSILDEELESWEYILGSARRRTYRVATCRFKVADGFADPAHRLEIQCAAEREAMNESMRGALTASETIAKTAVKPRDGADWRWSVRSCLREQQRANRAENVTASSIRSRDGKVKTTPPMLHGIYRTGGLMI